MNDRDPGFVNARLSRRNLLVAEGRSLLWDFVIENLTGQLLEIGELAIPLRADDDYGALYRGAPLPDAATLGRTTAIQKAIQPGLAGQAAVMGHDRFLSHDL